MESRIESYEDLDIWQASMSLVVEVYDFARALPDSERFNLVSQMQRAAVSVPSNIAEGWGRGRTLSQAQFLRIARGSLFEVLTQLEVVRRLGWADADKVAELRSGYQRLGKQLNAYLSWLEGSFAREEVALYGDRDHSIAPSS